jgi:hypothetical protein
LSQAPGSRLQAPARRAGAFAILLIACSPAGRDVVTDSHDVRVTPDAGATRSNDGYAYVVRRPHGAVGLVGAHFMKDDEARRIVDRIADDLETCARRLEQRGELVEGAVQLVAVTGSRGSAEVTDVRFAPGGPVAANALECIIAPLRATPFPTITPAGLPAVAIEATWNPSRAGNADAGGPL